MTADEITLCIDNFRDQHGVTPHTIFADLDAYESMLIEASETTPLLPQQVEHSFLFLGIQVVPDPSLHGIKVSA